MFCTLMLEPPSFNNPHDLADVCGVEHQAVHAVDQKHSVGPLHHLLHLRGYLAHVHFCHKDIAGMAVFSRTS